MNQPNHILVLDDSEHDTLLLEDLVQQAFGDAVEIHGCATPGEADRCLERVKADVCLVDYYLSEGKTGLAWAHRQFARQQTGMPPVIMLTGTDDLEAIDEYCSDVDSGVTDFLIKAELTPHLLARAMRYAVKQHQMVRQLHERRLRAELLFDCAREGLIELDAHGRIVQANRGAELLFGYAQRSMEGLYLAQLIKGFTMDDLRVMGKDARPQASSRMVRQVTGHDRHGKALALDMALNAIQGAALSLYVASFIDISQHVQIEEALQQQAHTDPLTGLMNRRCFRLRADRELRRAKRTKSAMTLLMLDIDYFKQVNDRYGHAAGDVALCALATVLRKGMRDVDVFSRWGGEEFLCLLPETDSMEAIMIAERIRQAVDAMVVPQVELGITISIGLAEVDVAQPLKEAIARSDQGLYRAKEAGRNRVSCAN
ncbi:MAG: diguanylate cyclase [Mariprofundales bacterium]|nr:diguanylate cyclase [Mariprofundales bacterium]